MELLAIPCESIHPSLAARNSPNSWVFSSFCILFFSPSLPPSPPPQVTGDPNGSAQSCRARPHHDPAMDPPPNLGHFHPLPCTKHPQTPSPSTHAPTPQPPKDSWCKRDANEGPQSPRMERCFPFPEALGAHKQEQLAPARREQEEGQLHSPRADAIV